MQYAMHSCGYFLTGFCSLRSEATVLIVFAGAVQQMMEGVAALAVPLTVNVSCGQQWGTLHQM